MAAEAADAVKARIYGEFKRRLTDLIEAEVRSRGNPVPSAQQQDPRTSQRGRRDADLISSLSGDPFSEEAAASSVSSSGDDSSSAVPVLTPAQRAEKAMRDYLNMSDIPSIQHYPMADMLRFWKEQGQEKHPEVAALARAVAALRASAANIEVDFCLAGHMVGPKRSRLDAAFVEMGLVLNRLGIEGLPRPEDVPALSVQEAAAAIPSRFQDDEMLAAAIELDDPYYEVAGRSNTAESRSWAAHADERSQRQLALAFDNVLGPRRERRERRKTTRAIESKQQEEEEEGREEVVAAVPREPEDDYSSGEDGEESDVDESSDNDDEGEDELAQAMSSLRRGTFRHQEEAVNMGDLY